MQTREEKTMSLLYDSNGLFKTRKVLKEELKQAENNFKTADETGKSSEYMNALRFLELSKDLRALLAEMDQFYKDFQQATGIPKDVAEVIMSYTSPSQP